MENNNEIFETKTEEVAAEEIAPAKKPLPWWIFAIIGVAVVAVVAVVLILVLGGNKCEHIDKNDDFLCDECGAEFDDGLEIITSTVTFELKDEAGAAMAGIKFTVESASDTYDLQSGADGKATVTLPVGTYDVIYDDTTIPFGFQPNLHVLRVKEDTTSVPVTVVDNNPNGSAERPYLVNDDVFAISIGAGEQVHYTCRVATFRNMKIEGAGIVILYGDKEYLAGEEFIITNDTTEVNFMASFSVKNTSSEKIDTEIVTIYEPGSRENPFAAEGNEITVNLEKGEIVYYKWTDEDRCILKAITSDNKCPVKLSKVEIKVGENGEELEIPIESETFEDDGSERIVVYANEEILIRISNESEGTISATITLEALRGE